jgi:hypothetical protein
MSVVLEAIMHAALRSGRARLVLLCTALFAVVIAMSATLLSAPTPAGAQPVTDVLVVSDIPVTPINGNAAILLGSDDGVISINCDGGSGPDRALGGPVVPAIVLDRLDPDATRLRITSWGANTPAVNGRQVHIGCSFEATVAAATLLRRLGTPAGRALIHSGTLPR